MASQFKVPCLIPSDLGFILCFANECNSRKCKSNTKFYTSHMETHFESLPRGLDCCMGITLTFKGNYFLEISKRFKYIAYLLHHFCHHHNPRKSSCTIHRLKKKFPENSTFITRTVAHYPKSHKIYVNTLVN